MIQELVRRIQEAHKLMEEQEKVSTYDSIFDDPLYRMYLGHWGGLKDAYALVTGRRYDWDYE